MNGDRIKKMEKTKDSNMSCTSEYFDLELSICILRKLNSLAYTKTLHSEIIHESVSGSLVIDRNYSVLGGVPWQLSM